ncbi:hypothetical protein GCM10010392_21520 [Streptomyces clavifer]|nr:hypothetical protein GCM10010392_21520 [Streptomyces clavifer]
MGKEGAPSSVWAMRVPQTGIGGRAGTADTPPSMLQLAFPRGFRLWHGTPPDDPCPANLFTTICTAGASGERNLRRADAPDGQGPGHRAIGLHAE